MHKLVRTISSSLHFNYPLFSLSVPLVVVYSLGIRFPSIQPTLEEITVVPLDKLGWVFAIKLLEYVK